MPKVVYKVLMMNNQKLIKIIQFKINQYSNKKKKVKKDINNNIKINNNIYNYLIKIFLIKIQINI